MTATREPLLTAAGVAAVRAVTDEFADALMLLATSKKPAVVPTTVPGCQHSPACPTADRIDHDAARVVFHDYNLDASKLCNGVWIYHNGSELAPDLTETAGHDWPAPHCTETGHGHACPCDPEEN